MLSLRAVYVCLCDQSTDASADSCITSDPFFQPHRATRSSSLPRKKRGNTRMMLYLYQTVPKEDCTSRSNATPPPATAGVCWWTPDGPYLVPPRGGRDFTYRKHMCYTAIWGLIYGTFTLIYKDSWNLLLDSFWQTNPTVVTQSRCDHSHHNTAEWPVDREAVQLDDPASCPFLANILYTKMS